MAKREPYSADLPIDAIYEGENLSREYYGDLPALADAIHENKWLAPLQVVKEGKRYRLTAGYRRFRAVKILLERGDWEGDTIPCQVFTTLTEAGSAALNVAENSEKTRLRPNPFEFFNACRQLKERHGFTSAQIAIRLGNKSIQHIDNCVRASRQLHPTILAALKNAGENPPVGMSTLFQIMSKTPDEQLAWWEKRSVVTPKGSSHANLEEDDPEPVRMRRRREIERAIKELRRIGETEHAFAAKCLQWALGERSEPWEE